MYSQHHKRKISVSRLNWQLGLFSILISLSINAQKLGVGLSNPIRRVSINGSLLIDQNNTNNGTLDSAALVFGSNSLTGIASKKTAGDNQNGLSFFTNSAAHMHISPGGNLSIGGLHNFNRFTVHNGNSHFGGNFEAAGNLAAGGSVDLSYRLRIYGESRFGGDFHATGNVGFGGVHDPSYVLRVWGTGITRFEGILNTAAHASVGGTPDESYRLRVYDGNTRLGGDVHATGNAAVGGVVDNNFRLRVYGGNTKLNGDAEITGDITLDGKGSVKSNGNSPLKIGFASDVINVFMPAHFESVFYVPIAGFPTNYSDRRILTAQIEGYDDNAVPIAGLKIQNIGYDNGSASYAYRLANSSAVAGKLHVTIYFAIIGKE